MECRIMAVVQVETGVMATRNAAFVCFHTDNYKHYAGAPAEWGEKALNADVTLFAAVVRWTGAIGFPGGLVEEGETILECAIRECREEIGFSPSAENLIPVCSHEINPGFRSHLFSYKVTPEELYDIQRNSVDAEHARLEGCGVIVYHSTKASRKNILNTPGAKSVREELEVLMDKGVI